ncbi:hypothetical protein FE391_39440, partial [Nonomuraea sp. KC401]|uniref:terpene synthase family protein n=2 Tax=unclassified Nonomuraea TaxID=2593643 RepID=UPI0010FE2D6F
MIPDAATGDVERLARWITVLFHLDDEQDEGPLGHCASAVLDLYQALTAVIDGHHRPALDPAPPPVIAAVADLWPATAAGMSPQWRRRFRDHLHRHRDAFLTQIEHRRRGSTPTPQEYPALRRDANGAFMYDLVEALHHAEVPPAIAQTPCWQQMCQASNDLTAWTNDLLSLPREAAAGESTNYVIVLQRASGCDLQSAVRQVSERIQDRARHMLAARRRLHHTTRTLHPHQRTGIAQIAHTICTMPGTHLAWLQESGRYPATAHHLTALPPPPPDIPPG